MTRTHNRASERTTLRGKTKRGSQCVPTCDKSSERRDEVERAHENFSLEGRELHVLFNVQDRSRHDSHIFGRWSSWFDVEGNVEQTSRTG